MEKPQKYLELFDLLKLSNSHCKIQNKSIVFDKINNLINGGTCRLQIVSDFDSTITKQRTEDGKSVPSSFGIFDACTSLPDWYVQESHRLYDKYHPIEIDPMIPMHDKVKCMIEWWTESSKLLRGFPFNIKEIDDIAVKYKNSLRDGSHEFFESLFKWNVPVLVFSAGLGNAVESVMRQSGILHPNVKIISNFLQYENGVLNGFQENMIHTFNKNETSICDSEYYNLVRTRSNVILMGDSLGDAGMAEGVPCTSNILKIGFLFHHIEENMQKYLDAFDIVLVDDQTMNIPRAILSVIDNKSQHFHN